MYITPIYSFNRASGTTQYAENELIAESGTAASTNRLKWSVEKVFGRGKIVAVKIFTDNEAVTAAIYNLDLFKSDPGVPTNGDNGAYAIASVRPSIVRVACDMSTGSFVSSTDKVQRFALSTPAVFDIGGNGYIYGLLSTGTSGTYTPASQELFEVTLEIMGVD